MKRFLAAIGLLGLFTTLLFCADASGKWKGSFEAGGTPRELIFDLKGSGNGLTGTVVGAAEKPSEIKEGKLEGADVSFYFMTEYQGNPVKLVCKGQLAGDEIRFTMGTDDGQWSTNFVAKKSS
jgi:hypothetical protein